MQCDCPSENMISEEHPMTWPLLIDGLTVSRPVPWRTCKTCGPRWPQQTSRLIDNVMPVERFVHGDNYSCLNLHAHTKWSDGGNTIEEMAIVAKNRGMPALVITDHDYSLMAQFDRHDGRSPELGKKRYLEQCVQAKFYSDKLNYPIIIGIESSMYRCEEALLFGREAILTFFDEREWLTDQAEDGIFEYPNFRKKNYAMVICHPSPFADYRPNAQLGLYRMAHGYEVVNTMHLWGEKEIERMRWLCPNGTPFFNIDAHGVNSLKDYYCNFIPKSVKIQNEDDLINWIKNRKVEWVK